MPQVTSTKAPTDSDFYLDKLFVRDFMAESFVSFPKDMAINDAGKLLCKAKISGGPVVDQGGELLGFLSQKECLMRIYRMRYYNEEFGKVGDYMKTPVATVAPEDNVFDLIEKFLNNHYHIYPVTKEGKVLGVVERNQVFRIVIEMKQSHWSNKA